MFEQDISDAEAKPNDPRLFNGVLRGMVQFAKDNGYDFPALELTEEERASVQFWNEGGPELKYWTTRWQAWELAVRDISNDSKFSHGKLVDYEIDGKTEVYITTLGEGPSIKYGEYGNLTLWNDDSTEITEYNLKSDGTVMVEDGKVDEQCVTCWKPSRQATDEELAELQRAFDYIDPITYPKVA